MNGIRKKMKCKYFTIRSKKYEKYEYCRLQKKNTDYEKCGKCYLKEYNNYSVLKKKSNKLAKLEKKRKSILTTKMKICYLCGSKAVDIHEIFKGSNRLTSIKNNFCIPLCRKCHTKTDNQIELLRYLQKECQKEYEKTHTREEFMKITGRNYL